MNIRTQNIEALLSQQELQAKKSATTKSGAGAGFADAFAEQAALGGAVQGAQHQTTPIGVQTNLVQQMLVQNAESIAATGMTSSTQGVMEQVSNNLSQWESYASKLQAPGGQGNLRDAHTLLAGIESQVSALKNSSQETLEQNPELASIVNELEVMSVTERIKFNRGDYIA